MPNDALVSAAVHDAPLPTPERIQELLFDAARLGRDDMIPALVQAGADVSAVDPKGHTPLILASYHDHGASVACLLRLGAVVDQPDLARGNTALMGVAFKGYLSVAELLLEAGAEPNRTNLAGQTALMMAALFNRTAIVDSLLHKGADVELRDGAGNSAISVALGQGNMPMADRLRLRAAI